MPRPAPATRSHAAEHTVPDRVPEKGRSGTRLPSSRVAGRRRCHPGPRSVRRSALQRIGAPSLRHRHSGHRKSHPIIIGRPVRKKFRRRPGRRLGSSDRRAGIDVQEETATRVPAAAGNTTMAADPAAVRQTPAVTGGRSSSPPEQGDTRTAEPLHQPNSPRMSSVMPSVSLIILSLPPETGAALDAGVRCCVTGRNQSPQHGDNVHHLSRWCAQYNRCCRANHPEKRAHHGSG